VTRLLASVFALVLVACHEAPPSAALQNQCVSKDECSRYREDRGGTPRCDDHLTACVREKTDVAYELFVRVKATTQGSELADAGIRLVPESVFSLGPLVEQRDAEVLRIPEAVSVPGSVRSEDDGGRVNLLDTELALSARDAMVPIALSVFETVQATNVRDGGTQFEALLDPALGYDLRVQPLLGSSTELPPLQIQDVAISKRLDVTYDNVASRSAKLVYRDNNARPLLARLQDKQTGEVVSSTVSVTPDNATGRYEANLTLYADPQVFERPERPSFNLLLGLANLDPWQVTITIDGARFLAGNDILLPSIPNPVKVSGNVEDEQRGRLANVQLVFVSNYPLPPPDDAGSSTPSAGGTDWCRWEDPTRINCNGRFQTLSIEDGSFELELVPGDYDAYVVPSTREPSSQGLIVTRKQKFVVTDQGKSGEPLPGNAADAYTGTITAGQVAAPQVTVRAWPRPTPAFSAWGPVANFNRTLSAVSDRNGHFELLPDVGYYDFVVDPGDGNNFPWKLWLDCPNGPDAGGALRAIKLSAPVMVSGVVEYADSGVPLPKAQVEAFAIVESTHNEPRSVLIGRAVSDALGAYRLVLPPRVGERDRSNPNCEGFAR
jgi:hypothetical protein